MNRRTFLGVVLAVPLLAAAKVKPPKPAQKFNARVAFNDAAYSFDGN